MGSPRICFLAQSEKPQNSDCDKCVGTTLLTLDGVAGSYSGKFFWAPYYFHGRKLWTWTIDQKPFGKFITGSLLERVLEIDGEKVFPVPVEKGFSDLCLFYVKEGGNRINVGAAISGVIVRPQGTGKVKGHDPNCPIKRARLSGKIYSLSRFDWVEDLTLKWNVPAEFRGGGTPSPDAGKDELELEAKQELPDDDAFVACVFQKWERTYLTPNNDPPETQTDPVVHVPQNSFASLIAHYEYVNVDPDPDEPQTIPGHISHGDPAPKRFVGVRQQRVAYEIARLAEGSIEPIRNDPRSAAHGSALRAPRIGRDLRARIARAAKAGADGQNELRALLSRLPPAAD